jgi:hypothetical protein
MSDETPEAAAAVPASHIQSVASEVASVDENVMKFLPYISTLLGFIPGAQIGVPIVGGVGLVLKAVDDAAKAVATGTPGTQVPDIFTAIVDHLTPGKPNSPLLL